MYSPEDTIVAVSSSSSGPRVIIRISGSRTNQVCSNIFRPESDSDKPYNQHGHSRIINGQISIDDQLCIDGYLYLFFEPHSYTGQDLAEIHLFANRAVLQVLTDKLLGMGLRMAEPGEFTARAYLNGKIDLSQAEAVNEIIVGSNSYQISAAQSLLTGKLSQTTEIIRKSLVDLLALIEAGLDFSEEDIEFISRDQAIDRVRTIDNQLKQLMAGSISYESVLDMASVGIAGTPNAGKSSLLNKLLGRQRSIVSATRKTTRDVLTGVLSLKHCDCVVFDCAGLIAEPSDIMDELAQNAAIEALQHSSLILFCVDIAKEFNANNSQTELWAEDIDLWSLVIFALFQNY